MVNTNRRIQSLLYKEYLLLKQSLRVYGGLVLLYWIFAKLGIYPPWIAVLMGQIVPILAPLSLFQRENSDYLAVLPSGRELAVFARYLTALALTMGSFLFNLLILLVLFANNSNNSLELPLITLLFATFMGVFTLDIALPLFYALGSRRGKPWFFLMVLTPVALLALRIQELEQFYSITLVFVLFFGILMGILAGFYSFRVALGYHLEKDIASENR